MSELQSFHANNTSIIVGHIVCFNACKFGQPIKIVVCNDENVRTLLYLPCKKKRIIVSNIIIYNMENTLYLDIQIILLIHINVLIMQIISVHVLLYNNLYKKIY